MRLYHVGYYEIKEPDIHYGRKNADFGQGFYTTTDKEFAYRWAKESPGQKTIINEYELDVEGLAVKTLVRNEEWFEYIYGNRHRKPDEMAADVIIGPIANDIIYDTLGITTSGFLSKEESMKLLMIGPEYVQVVIKSEEANANLQWLFSKEITSAELELYHHQMEEEEEAFQVEFAEKLGEMEE